MAGVIGSLRKPHETQLLGEPQGHTSPNTKGRLGLALYHCDCHLHLPISKGELIQDLAS